MTELEKREQQLLVDAAGEMAQARRDCLMVIVCRGDNSALADAMDPVMAMSLLGHLQLALAHPSNNGPASQRMRELAKKIEARLAELGPATALLCAMGWNRRFDR